jgi:glycosyltransferase involved in cell wall biosynthesis
MDISVIIPAYNAALYVREAVDSVLAQTCPVQEILVVDDGSTDDTVGMLASYGSPLRIIRQQHCGSAATRNTGIRAAGGDVLAFLDADDLWVPNRIERQGEHLEAHDMVFGMAQQFISPELTPDEQALRHCPPHPQPGYVPGAMLVRRPAFERVGWFDPRWRVGEFVDWYCRAQELGLSSSLLPDIVLRRRIHKANLTTTARAGTDYAHILRLSLKRRRSQ